MLIKSADDKTKRLKLLLDLQSSPMLDAFQKEKLGKMLHALRRGIAGEREAAHYIDKHCAHEKNCAVIHDLVRPIERRDWRQIWKIWQSSTERFSKMSRDRLPTVAWIWTSPSSRT